MGGFQLLANTMQTNFGFIQRNMMIDMEGFIEVIDALGGIEFITDYYTADACDGSLNPNRWCEVGPEKSLNSMALWYVSLVIIPAILIGCVEHKRLLAVFDRSLHLLEC